MDEAQATGQYKKFGWKKYILLIIIMKLCN